MGGVLCIKLLLVICNMFDFIVITVVKKYIKNFMVLGLNYLFLRKRDFLVSLFHFNDDFALKFIELIYRNYRFPF